MLHTPVLTTPVGKSGDTYIIRCHMLGPELPEAVSPDRVLYLPTFRHLLIINELLSLSLSLSPSLFHSRTHARARSLSHTQSHAHACDPGINNGQEHLEHAACQHVTASKHGEEAVLSSRRKKNQGRRLLIPVMTWSRSASRS